MIGRERRAERAAGVAGRRLDPDLVEAAVAQDLAVGDAIERDAAGEAEIRLRRSRARASASAAARPPRSPPGSRRPGPCGAGSAVPRGVARRPAEQLVELLVGHGQAGAIVEIAQVEPERAVALEVDQIVEDSFCAYFGSP